MSESTREAERIKESAEFAEDQFRWLRGPSGGPDSRQARDAIEELAAHVKYLVGCIDRDRATIAKLEGLLGVARCPNVDCCQGVVPHGPDPDGHWDAEQCQWCYERKALEDTDE